LPSTRGVGARAATIAWRWRVAPATMRFVGRATTDHKVEDTLRSDKVFGEPGDYLPRAATLERSEDGAREVLECECGTHTAHVTPGQGTLQSCETQPSEPAPTP